MAPTAHIGTCNHTGAWLWYGSCGVHISAPEIRARPHNRTYCPNMIPAFPDNHLFSPLGRMVCPDMSHANCSWDISMTSCFVRGHWYLPSRSRLQRRRKPSPSQMRHLILSGFSSQDTVWIMDSPCGMIKLPSSS